MADRFCAQDQIFKHKDSCEWPYKYTKTEFEAFHCNKRVWEHQIDHYTIQGDYQRYEYYADSLGNAEGIKKLAAFTGDLDITTMDIFEQSLRQPILSRKTRIEEMKRESKLKNQYTGIETSIESGIETGIESTSIETGKNKMNVIL